MQTSPRFGFSLPISTQEGAEAFIRDVLDKQIEELQGQLEILQAHRRALASTFGIDRRDSASKLGQVLDAADRADKEGDGDRPNGRLVPRGVPEKAA